MRPKEILSKARRVREIEHHLRPDLRLRTLEAIQGFVHDRGIVSVFGGNELPSIISGIMGREWKPSKKGFSGWQDWWSIKISGIGAGRALAELDRAENILATRIFRQSKTLVSEKLWPILDPIVKHHQHLTAQHKILSEVERKILKLLAAKAPMRTDHIRSQLKLEGKEFSGRFHRALSRLESYALIVGFEDPKPERHLHANIWQLWGQRVPLKNSDLSYEEACGRLFEKTIDACVLAPLNMAEEWFEWSGHMDEMKRVLLERGRIVEADSFLVASRVASDLS